MSILPAGVFVRVPKSAAASCRYVTPVLGFSTAFGGTTFDKVKEKKSQDQESVIKQSNKEHDDKVHKFVPLERPSQRASSPSPDPVSPHSVTTANLPDPKSVEVEKAPETSQKQLRKRSPSPPVTTHSNPPMPASSADATKGFRCFRMC